MDSSQSLVDRILLKLNNNRLIAYVVVFAIVVTGIAAFTSAVSQLIDLASFALHRDASAHRAPQSPTPAANSRAASDTTPFDPQAYKAKLVDLAHQGCYFFHSGQFAQFDLPDFLTDAQASYIDQITPDSGPATYLVMGYMKGDSGTREFDLAVATQRARWVKEYLQKKYNIDPKSISIMSLGREKPSPQIEGYFCGARLIADPDR